MRCRTIRDAVLFPLGLASLALMAWRMRRDLFGAIVWMMNADAPSE